MDHQKRVFSKERDIFQQPLPQLGGANGAQGANLADNEPQNAANSGAGDLGYDQLGADFKKSTQVGIQLKCKSHARAFDQQDYYKFHLPHDNQHGGGGPGGANSSAHAANTGGATSNEQSSTKASARVEGGNAKH